MNCQNCEYQTDNPNEHCYMFEHKPDICLKGVAEMRRGQTQAFAIWDDFGYKQDEVNPTPYRSVERGARTIGEFQEIARQMCENADIKVIIIDSLTQFDKIRGHNPDTIIVDDYFNSQQKADNYIIDDMWQEREQEREQVIEKRSTTPKSGRSQKQHNNIVNLNKRSKRWLK